MAVPWSRLVLLLSVETFDAITARRNVRSFTGDRLTLEVLERILEAGRRSPSSMNQQAWDFVLVTDRDHLRDLARVWRHADHVASSAATIALVAPTSTDPDEREIYQFDLGQVAMSMMLAAADLGVGSCHAAVGEQELARELLGLPAMHECMWLIAFGVPEGRALQPIARPARRPLDEVVHRETW